MGDHSTSSTTRRNWTRRAHRLPLISWSSAADVGAAADVSRALGHAIYDVLVLLGAECLLALVHRARRWRNFVMKAADFIRRAYAPDS